MKKLITRFGLAGMVAAMGVSCTTTYDQYGRARQAISPEGALLGAAALGAVAYSVGKDRGKDKGYRRGYNKGSSYGNYGGYGGYGGYGNYGGYNGYRGGCYR